MLSSYLLNYIYTKSAWVSLFAKVSVSVLGILSIPSRTTLPLEGTSE